MDGWMDGWMDGLCVCRWMDGWMGCVCAGGWMDVGSPCLGLNHVSACCNEMDVEQEYGELLQEAQLGDGRGHGALPLRHGAPGQGRPRGREKAWDYL